MATVDVYLDYICPWCWLGSTRTARLVREHGVQVRVRPFPLHPGLPEEGTPIRALLRGRDPAPIHARLAALCAAEGLAFVPPERAWNSRRAMELALWADRRGGPPLHDALLRAVFVEGRNIGEPEQLLAVAVAAGHDEDAVRDALAERPMRAEVEETWAEAHERGVSGVPTWVSGARGVIGAQPYEVLERLVTEG